VPIVHVTHFNRLMWDNGLARTFVVEHGVVDPGYRYTGEVARAAVVTNDPVRRERFVGADLYRTLAKGASLDIFGMRVDQLAGAGLLPPGSRVFEDLPQRELHQELARRRVYLHTTRWTSLGLSLIEAMMMGMPVVGLGSTEIHRAVPAEAGAVSTDPRALNAALRRLVHEPELARKLGLRARAAATQRYNLPRFLDDWERVFASLPTPARSA
jgi:glycosyltransferase involved in cell wall biosynthesis